MMHELFNSGSFSDEKKLLNSSETQQNIRCPRCDSPNTKFCYYNNYNLTQPRHFCKTCRRYWTKGGALRNVPIGGGCRKARPLQSTMSVSNFTNATHKSGYNRIAKLPTATTDQFDAAFHRFLPAATMWDNTPHDSHLLTLLKASQMQQQHQQQSWQPNILNDVPTNSGIQEFYQRLKSSTAADYYSSPSATATTANTAEPIPLSVDMGSWNSNMTWSDIWTTNAANNK